MYHHAPENYVCPFCLVAQQVENECVFTKHTDIIYRDELISAFINSHHWPRNSGHVVIIPNQHYENLYELPLHLATRIHACARAIALAMKVAYRCEGISARQHNEPAGNQEVWHYHLHVFPRYSGDELYTSQKGFMAAEVRAEYAHKLRVQLKEARGLTTGCRRMGTALGI